MDAILQQIIESVLNKLEELAIEIIKVGEANNFVIAQLIHLLSLLEPVIELVQKEYPKSAYLLNIVNEIISKSNNN